MSTAHPLVVDVLLGVTVASCWLGAIGMIRMRDAYQALHYLGLPAIVGVGSVTAAVFVETGWTQASWKCALMLVVFIIANSVGTHAAARAFRQREKKHWEPLPEDAEVEFLGGRPQP